MSDKKLVRVTMEYEDGTAFYHDGEDAEEWDEKVNGAVTFQAVRSGNPDPWGFGPLHKRQKEGIPWNYDPVRKWLDERKGNLQREMKDGAYSDQLALIAHLEKHMNELEGKP